MADATGEQSQRTHYVPQWLLREFMDGSRLCSFNLYSALISTRVGLKVAGSGDQLWPKHIEDDVMSKHDDAASKIFQRRIRGRRRIVLSESDRWHFALWLALFMPRVPNAAIDMKRMIEEAKDNPEIAVKLMYERRGDVLRMIRSKIPDAYDEMVREFGRLFAEEWTLIEMAHRIRNKTFAYWPEPDSAYHAHLQTTKVDEFAKILCEYEWVWLYSAHGFVIGDNPFVRWHAKSEKWNYGIRRSGVEITIPLGTHLALRLERRHWQHNGRLQFCPRKLTREYNRRQRIAATGYVYAGTPGLLEQFREGIPEAELRKAAKLGPLYQPER